MFSRCQSYLIKYSYVLNGVMELQADVRSRKTLGFRASLQLTLKVG
jgi:hypothetical protein